MKRLLPLIGVLAISVAMAACGAGGTETGNPLGDDIRTVTGTVTASTSSSLATKSAATTRCEADTVVARDSSDNATSAEIDGDCEFAIGLAVNEAYEISFERLSEFVGVMQFAHHRALHQSEAMRVGRGTTRLRLGKITFANKIGTPANEPSLQNDYDGDGVVDFDDDDDDGNGTSDEDEADCDLDGFLDDVDNDTSSCESAVVTARVLRVHPRHDFRLSVQARRVPLSAPVNAEVSCALDEATVTASTFAVTSATDTMACVFAFANAGRRMVCTHSDDPFAPNTTYTVTIDGVQCSDGTTVHARSWSWKTRSS